MRHIKLYEEFNHSESLNEAWFFPKLRNQLDQWGIKVLDKVKNFFAFTPYMSKERYEQILAEISELSAEEKIKILDELIKGYKNDSNQIVRMLKRTVVAAGITSYVMFMSDLEKNKVDTVINICGPLMLMFGAFLLQSPFLDWDNDQNKIYNEYIKKLKRLMRDIEYQEEHRKSAEAEKNMFDEIDKNDRESWFEVTCSDDSGVKYLTQGETYVVEEEDDWEYYVKNDNGERRPYKKERFDPVAPH